MTPSAQLAPVHALLHARTDAFDAAAGKGTRRATQRPTSCLEVPGYSAHFVRYDGDVVSIGNDRFSLTALRHKLGNDGTVSLDRVRKGFRAAPTEGGCGRRAACVGGPADVQRLAELGDLVQAAVLESVTTQIPHPSGRAVQRPPLPHPPVIPPTLPPPVQPAYPLTSPPILSLPPTGLKEEE
eukprot:2249194-Pleurochrysis_carterae.AAC.2